MDVQDEEQNSLNPVKQKFNLGGLDLSRSCLDRDSRSRHWQRAGLDSRENLDTFKKLVLTIEISRFCLDTTFQSQKSRSRSRNLSRHEIFGKSRQFVSILIKSQSILSHFSIEISQFVNIFDPEVPQKVSIMSRYLDKSQKVSTNLENLDKSQ